MGKGLMGLNPLHSDKFLFSNVSLAGLITMLYTCTDMKTFLCGKYHYFLYYLVLSMYPRMLITVIYTLLMSLLVEWEFGADPDLCARGHVSWHCGCSWKAEIDHWIPDARHPSPAWPRRESWARDRGVPGGDSHYGKFRNPQEESRVRGIRGRCKRKGSNKEEVIVCRLLNLRA
jgi:hypothetical protein